MKPYKHSRRQFIRITAGLSAAFILPGCSGRLLGLQNKGAGVPVYAHLWVYASRFPPNWDCTPIMNEVFSDLKYAGLQGVEVMEVHLRQPGAVERFKSLVQQHGLPVKGASYNGIVSVLLHTPGIDRRQ